ncbi:MAG: hypothetical protein EOM40_17065 [Clostridia bacterium]|nr:hypothetical protein [Clostridia bacterium]
MMIAASLILFAGISAAIAIDYFRKKQFYDELIDNMEHLDQKYLILEMLSLPHFYDGELLCQTLYDYK